MALRAIVDGQACQAWALPDAAWQALRARSRAGGRDMLMPCCASRAVPKTSKMGYRFFSHYAASPGCQAGGESAEHVRLKTLLARAAEQAGWTVTTEGAGSDPDGQPWRADVLAEKDGTRFALEVQLSPQDHERYRERQESYRKSGLFGLWFARRLPAGYLESRSLPVWRLAEDAAGEVRVKGRLLGAFLQDFLEGRYVFVPPGAIVDAPACLVPVPAECPNCGRAILRTPVAVLFPGEVRPGWGRRIVVVAESLRADQANRLIRARCARDGSVIGRFAAARQPKSAEIVRFVQTCPHCGAPQTGATAASPEFVRAAWRDPGVRDGCVLFDGERLARRSGWLRRDEADLLTPPAPAPERAEAWLRLVVLRQRCWSRAAEGRHPGSGTTA